MSGLSKDVVFEIVKGVIAVVIVFGGGYAILTGNAHAEVVAPIISLVIGYYFGVATTQAINAGKAKN